MLQREVVVILRRDFHHLTLIWTNVNVKSLMSVLGRACFRWQASQPRWVPLAHLASSRPSLCSAAHILNFGWAIETARCVRGGAMAINQSRVILRQSAGMQFLSVMANLEEVKKKRSWQPRRSYLCWNCWNDIYYQGSGTYYLFRFGEMNLFYPWISFQHVSWLSKSIWSKSFSNLHFSHGNYRH